MKKNDVINNYPGGKPHTGGDSITLWNNDHSARFTLYSFQVFIHNWNDESVEKND